MSKFKSINPIKILQEPNIELVKETYSSDNNDSLKRDIKLLGMEPEPKVWVGDKFKLKPEAINYMEDQDWLNDNNIGYDETLYNIIEYAIRNDTEFKCIAKFKGGSSPDYTWWSLIKNDLIDNYMNQIYIPDIFIKNNTPPSYKPRKFIYESKELMYYNNIENKQTRYKYRYKTLKEFENEFGSNWRERVPLSWIYQMDYLLGKNVQSNDIRFDKDIVHETGGYNISKDMIKKNKLSSPTYKPKTFVYENFNIEKFNYNLLKESLEEFEKDYNTKPEDNVEDFLKYYDDLYEKLNKENIHFINNKLNKENKPLKENIDEYNRRIRDLDVNTIILDGETYNEKLKKELIELLIKIGVINGMGNIEGWDSNNEINENTAFVITLNNCVNSTLSKNHIYNSSKSFIENGDLIKYYPELKPTDIMNVSGVINFIKNRIIFQNAVDMYKPKKFIYESDEWYPYRFKTEEEMIRDYGTNWRLGDDFESGWNEEMDHLLGQPYPYEERQVKHNRSQPRIQRLDDGRGNNWSIDWNMLTKIKPIATNMYKPKKFVYENIKKLGEF